MRDATEEGIYVGAGEGRVSIMLTEDETIPWTWDGGGNRGDGTHSLSLSYCECTGSFVCTNWCCSSSMVSSSTTTARKWMKTMRAGERTGGKELSENGRSCAVPDKYTRSSHRQAM